ncbi:MobA/MobL family protein [Mariprofundus aestuarium]|uniref:MobA/MobL family protein n=1 Tax=Mariprofundus aestuarium TaxID=1921086 RepID=A0A2K8KX65_MARES|nr:MobA/MobL family protein [Mariprofundus aestuarium]ATX79530.1 MobA/MobL family protein [Mariprofundus aestuarium]
MSEFHLSLNIGAKGKAGPHFHYISASEKYAKKHGVVHIESGNMPIWATAEPALFWEASDKFERANGTTYRELEVALPRELPFSIQLDLARQLAEEVCDTRHAYSFAIHHTKASDGGLNPHVHLQFSERIQDGIERDAATFFKRANKAAPEKGGCVKDRSWQASKRGKQKHAESSTRLLEIREQWADMCNQALSSHGSDARVDHRSNVARGIYLLPQPKVGAKSWHLQRRTEKRELDPVTNKMGPMPFTGVKNERFKHWEEVISCNKAIIAEQSNHAPEIQRRLADAERELAALVPINRPDRQEILRNIAEGQQSARRLAQEIWKLEHVTRRSIYNSMMRVKQKYDAGGNWLVRAFNQFRHRSTLNQLKKKHDAVLFAKSSKIKKRERFIERLCLHPYAIKEASEMYTKQAVQHSNYLASKRDLELEIESIKASLSCQKSTSQPLVYHCIRPIGSNSVIN